MPSAPTRLRPRLIYGALTLAVAMIIGAPGLVSAINPQAMDGLVTAVDPCRAVFSPDWNPAAFGGDAKPQADHTYNVSLGGAVDMSDQGGPGGGCGVPSQAGAVVAVVKAVQPAGAGNFKFADGNTDPTTVSGSQLSFQKLSPAVNLGTEVLIPVHTDGTANVRVQLSATHVSITIIGYVQDAKDLFHTRAQALDLFAQRSNVVPVHYVATDNATDIAAGNPTTGTVVSVNFDIVDECSGLFSRDEHKLLVTATFMTDEGGGDLDLDAYVRINGVDAAPTGDNLEVITALESNNQHYVIKVLIDNPDANNDGDHTDNTDVVGSGNHTVALVIDNYDDDAVSLDEASITVEHVGWNCGSSIIIFP